MCSCTCKCKNNSDSVNIYYLPDLPIEVVFVTVASGMMDRAHYLAFKAYYVQADISISYLEVTYFTDRQAITIIIKVQGVYV